MIFESHAHYDDEAFDGDREEILGQMQEGGIEYIVNIGANMQSSKQTLELTKKYPFIYGAVGVHPEEISELNEENMKWLKNACQDEKIVAVGEIGLDYYREKDNSPLQKKWFEAQLELAREAKLPVVIHSRDAAFDTLELMKGVHAGEIGGVIHCFSYGVEMAKSYLDMGFYLGVGGVVTFKNGRRLKEVVEYAPLESLLLETDTPYLSPEPNRGKRNTSLNIPYIVAEIARIKGISEEEVIEKTNQNAKKMYGID